MIIGSIDIGSNTVLLLVAEIINKKLIPILNEYMSPRLGKGLKENGKILDDRVNHLLDILREYKKICESHNCERIIISATNAMRIASNSKDIIDIVRAKLGLEIKVISGAEEAKLSYLGASSTFKEFPKKIVIDIGGGSTEIIYGEQSNIKFKNSFKVGVVSLTESFLNEFPHPQKNILSLQNHLDRIFESLTNTIPNSVPIIAVAGTPTTLSCIKLKKSEGGTDKLLKGEKMYYFPDFLY